MSNHLDLCEKLDGSAKIATEQRATPRFIAKGTVKLRNLTLVTEDSAAIIRDFSALGIRVETRMVLRVGDAVRIDLAGTLILAEVVYCRSTSDGFECGLKNTYAVGLQRLAEWLQQGLWTMPEDLVSA